MMRFLTFIWILLLSVISLHANTHLNVGIYNNSPKIFIDKNDQPAGFFVDLLSAIAKERQWELNYISCDWEECLAKLEQGEIDIMPDVAHSKEREKRFTFGDEVVISSWSMVYGSKGNTILSILDLHHKRVAVLKDSIQDTHLKEQSLLFGIEPYFVKTMNFSDAIGLLEAKKVDAAVINNFYDTASFDIERTNLFLSPVILKFAFAKNLSENIKNALDTTLIAYKKDVNSPFYEAKKRWLEVSPKQTFPPWAKWVFLALVVAFMTFLGLSIFFKHLLNLKIKALKESEKFLLAQSRNAAMGEMISMIAHQWKQPLAILSMIANNIKADVELGIFDAKNANTYHQQLSDQIFYLSHTIDDFSNFFKPNKEKVLVKELSMVIENALSLMGKMLENNHINVIKHYSKVENILIYPNELMQVIINIIKNAKEAFCEHPHETMQITIRTSMNSDAVYIEIEDNAGGIDENIREKIFEPYFTTKENLNGTGLGLYMSKSIIENHFNGTISVTCSEGKSLFVIKFPL